MKFSKLLVIAFILAASFTGASKSFAFSGAGAGTLGDPYMITSCLELNEIASGLGDNYKLANDIDCSSGGTLSFGTSGTPFTGDFDGAGYAVTVGITTVGIEGSGLFGYISGAHIHDLRINGNIVATGNSTGAVAGVAGGGTTIERVVNAADIRGYAYVGGIVGFANSVTITNSYNIGAISGNGQFGGIIGFMTGDATISNSYNKGQIGRYEDSSYHLGGFTGWRVSGSTITNSFNAGAVLTGQSTFFFGGLWGNDQDATSAPSAGMTNNYYDISRSTRTMCGYNNSGHSVGPVVGECEGVNSGNSSIHYFKDDASNAPLTSWDFTTIWETNTDGYPSLRSIPSDGGVTNDDPDVTAPIISEVTPVTTPTRAYSQDYTFTTNEAGTILFGGSCSMGDGTATVGSNTVQFGLGTGTYSDCTIQVRDAGGNLSNTITVTSFTVDHSFLGVGDGTEDFPYRVTTCEELQSLQGNVGEGSHVTLWNDVDCSATATWNEDPENLGQYFGFLPIENFQGIFVGGGHTISGLTIHDDLNGKAGLFTEIGGSALVYGFSLTDITVTGGDDHVGGLAGTINGTVVGVHVQGTVNSSAGRVGGFAGLIQTWGGVSKSSFNGTVTGGVSSSGGFTGYAVNTSITDSYADATVNGGSYAVGGFVGMTSSCCTYLRRNYATGAVTATGGNVGGFVGQAEGGSDVVYADNFTSTTVSGGDNHGAFVGLKENTMTLTSNYYDSTSNGSDTCIAFGGEVGDECTGVAGPGYFYLAASLPLSHWNFTTTWYEEEDNYPLLLPVESIASPTEPENVAVEVDGLDPTVTWEIPTSDGGLPITGYRVQMKLATSSWSDPLIINSTTSSLSYDDNDGVLDYGGTYDVQVAAINGIGIGDYSNAVRVTVGDSTVHEISSCAQLQAMDTEADTYTDTFNLTQNIDCSGIPNFRALGNGGWNSSFRGVFDGHGYTISNLTIDLPEEGEVGLFKATDRATIKNVTLHTGSVTGFYSTGALVGYSYNSIISNVHSDLSVAGIYNEDWGWGGGETGGLIGYLYSDGSASHNSSISNSSSSGIVNGSYNVGGLIGYLYEYPDDAEIYVTASVTNNSFTGTVQGDSNHGGDSVGGLIGYLELDSTSDDDTGSAVAILGNSVESSNIYGTESIGGIVGYIDSYTEYENNTNTITIADNLVTVTVTATDSSAGGLIGYIENGMDNDDESFHFTVEGNSVEAEVTSGGPYAGGLIGYENIDTYGDNSSAYVTIDQNRAIVSVGSFGYSGGLVGYIDNYRNGNEEFLDTMSKNYATGSVSANGGYVGGLIGSTYIGDHILNISDSYFNGSLGSTGGVGGIIGVSSSGSGGVINIKRSYAAGTVAAYASGGDAGGLVGKNDEGTLTIDHSFAANSMNADHTKGSIVGTNNSGNSATLYLDEVYYDNAINSLGCVDDQTVGGCAPVNTFEDPDPAYFTDNSTNAVFAGEGAWDFSTVWTTVVATYPLLRTTFSIPDVTPPILTEITPIAAQTTIENAVYHFSISEICTPVATPPTGPGSPEIHISDLDDSNIEQTAYLSGMQAGGTYSFTFNCRDANGNESNTLTVGPFTIITPTTAPTGGAVPVQFLMSSPGNGNSGNGGSSNHSAPAYTGLLGTDGCTGTNKYSSTTGALCGSSSGSSNATSSSKYLFTKDLKRGMDTLDVQYLQAFLNTHGSPVAISGMGSLGKEVATFGKATQKAVIKYQKDNKITPASGLFGPKTRAFVNAIIKAGK